VSVPPAPPLLLASTSPQRRTILHQLGIPFDAVAPLYEEVDPPEADAEQLVCEHAVGQARSVLDQAAGRPVLGVDTTVVLGGRLYAKAKNAGEAERMLEELSGRTHAVVSGLCLATPAWEVVSAIATRVTFRKLTPRDLATYVASGEWEGRAGAYAIQGRGGALVRRVEGDYLNVVGLPASLLVQLLADRFPGVYGFG
jgi:septum formation protein